MSQQAPHQPIPSQPINPGDVSDDLKQSRDNILADERFNNAPDWVLKELATVERMGRHIKNQERVNGEILKSKNDNNE